MKIIKVRFRSKAEFTKHYNSELANGGLFCPTTTEFTAGDEVVIELNVEGLPNKVMLKAHVVSWRPALPRLRVRAGALVELDEQEAPKRDFILGVVSGERRDARRRRHTRLPVLVPVSWRMANSVDVRQASISEVSVGGALLKTDEVLGLGEEVIIELTTPGGSAPISISGKVTYLAGGEGCGVKFIYRDGGGSRRIREVIRRIKTHS
jgi:Tfp pilus assembly protein PilZ